VPDHTCLYVHVCVLRSAGQLAANDSYKRLLADEAGELTVARRLAAGAAAGMTATALTHPLDTVRLRLALPGHQYRGAWHAASSMVATEGLGSLYRGLAPTLVGIAPYAALNFATYDLLKKTVYHGERCAHAHMYTHTHMYTCTHTSIHIHMHKHVPTTHIHNIHT
jgi:Mitochondrial carrier protein